MESRGVMVSSLSTRGHDSIPRASIQVRGRMTCTKCKTEKEPANFRLDASCALGYRTDCKSCEAAYNAKRPKYKRKDPTYNCEAQRRYRDRLRAKGMIKSQTRRRSPTPQPPERSRAKHVYRSRSARVSRRLNLSAEEKKQREAARKRSPHSKALEKIRKYRRRRAKGKFTGSDIEQLRELQHDRCAYCGISLTIFQVDHVTPLSKNGTNEPSNLLLACQFCNLSKGVKMLDQWQQDRGFTLLPLMML